MNNNTIMTYNLNSWMPVNKQLTFAVKMKVFAAYTRKLYGEPKVIMLQEMIAGRDQKYLKLLKTLFPDYEGILPAFDYFKHPQSIMAVTLIRKDILENYTVEVIDTELPNRINCVLANLEGKLIRLINIHMVQITNFKNQAPWYIQERTRLRNEMWELLLAKAKLHQTEHVIIAGDLQERNTAPHVRQISDMGYMMAGTHKATVNNPFFTENQIDHILFSQSAFQIMKPMGIMVDSFKVGFLSDHAICFAPCVP